MAMTKAQKKAFNKRQYEKKKAERERDQADLQATRPRVTRERAAEFVKMLSAGLPAMDALLLIVPAYCEKLTPETLKGILAEWMADALVLEAANEWNHGAWQEIDDERREEIALAHAYNQMAHFLYTHTYHECGGNDLKKWADAREALQARVDAKSGAGEGAYEKFLAQILANTAMQGPPQLTTKPGETVGVLTMPAIMKES